jgi:UDP-N-acetylmuramoyl-L-alanyl-D-glutamate--2,6-diaminopimelate ligase
MKIREVIQILDQPLLGGDKEQVISAVVCDSRSVLPGAAFVCIEGARFDGHAFIEEAIQRGAILIITERVVHVPKSVGFFRVESSREALARLAHVFHGAAGDRLHLTGITGTNGKTSTAFILQHLLKSASMKTGLIGTVQYDLGDRVLPAQRTTPEANELHAYLDEMQRCDCEAAVMEVSSHAIDMKRVSGLLFDVVLFTNLSHDHLDYHTDMENYFQVKRRLFSQTKENAIAIVNGDDAYGQRLMQELSVPVIAFGEGKNTAVQVRADQIKTRPKGTCFYMYSPWGEGWIHLPLLGRFHVANALAAMSVGGSYGLSFKAMQAAIKRVPSIPGRLELIRTYNQRRVFIDYAHTPDALEAVLNTLRSWVRGKLWVVFGCGGNRDQQKRRSMGRIASTHADMVVLTSDNPRGEDPSLICFDILEGWVDSSGPHVEIDRKKAIGYAMLRMKRGDVLLVAGKGHETYQEVNGTVVPFEDRLVIEAWSKRCS